MKIKLFHVLMMSSLIILSFSCKKSSSSSSYYFKVFKNGAWVNYPSMAAGIQPDELDNTKTDLSINGYTANNSDVFSVDVQVSGSTISPGTYYSNNTVTSNTQISDDVTIGPGNLESFNIMDSAGAPTYPSSIYSVTITSITSTEITGTFTGNYLYDDIDGIVLPATQGQFQVKRLF